jgi:hypothetical protein
VDHQAVVGYFDPFGSMYIVVDQHVKVRFFARLVSVLKTY